MEENIVKKRTLFLSLMITLISVFLLVGCDRGEVEESDPTTIVDPIVFSVSLNSSSKTLVQGDSFILVATIDGITDYDSIGWAQEGNLLQIAPNGLNAVITAGTQTGVETITVTVTKGDVSESVSCEVTVNTIVLDLTLDQEDITLDQGDSITVALDIDPNKTQTVVTWAQEGSLLTIVSNNAGATFTAGAQTGTTTVTVTATIFGETFEKEINVTVNEIEPYVDILMSEVNVNVDAEIEIDLDFLAAYQQDAAWSVSFSNDTFAEALVNEEDKLVVTGLLEGQTTLTLTMTTNDETYTDTLVINVKPLGYVGIAGNVYDPFDMQINFTESNFFSSIDENIWQAYNIIFGSANNAGEDIVRGEFVFSMVHQFAKDGEKDVIQVMANGASAMAIKIPDSIDDLAAFEISMKMATLDASHDRTWRLDFFMASMVEGKMMLYARANPNAIALGSLSIPPVDLLREGYHTYRFDVSSVPQNAGNYILIYFGNTNLYNGADGNRTYIDGFNFLSKSMTGITLTTPANDLEYVVGQSFDPTGLVVSSVYTLGNDVAIDHSDLTFDYDFSTPGTKTVTVSYLTYSVTFDVTVVEKAISSIEISTQPTKLVYTAGEMFDPAGMVVTAIYNDETTEVVTEYTYDETALVAGSYAFDIEYAGLVATVPLTVNSTALQSIAVTTPPTKVVYVVGQSVNYAGIVVTATYADTTTEVIPFEALAFSGFDASVAVEDQVITVTYGTQTTTFIVDIIEKVPASIQVKTFPQVTYAIDEVSNFSGLVVELVYNDDSKETLAFEDLVITGFDSSVAGQIEIVVAYLTFETAFNVMITDEEGYTQVLTSEVNFVTEGLVASSTMYHELFSGETPADRANYDVLLGRTLNDTQRLLQYSEAIYMSGEGAEAVIIVQTNGMSAMAVRIPEGLTAADITAFSFSMKGDHIVVADTVTFRPSFRFSSIAEGTEYFHTTNTGTYSLAQSGALTITQPDFTRTGFHDYTVEINQPTLAEGVTLGNYLIIYMGNNGAFRDSSNSSLQFNGFKFWTRDVVADITLTSAPAKTTYEVGETFDPTGLVVTPLYGVSLYNAPAALNNNSLVFDYDFSTVGEKIVTASYGALTIEIPVTVIEVIMTGLEVTTPPDKVSYNSGETFDPTGLVITALFDNETSEVVTEYTVDTTTPLVGGQTFIEVSYNGLTVQVPITVSAATLSSIAVTELPTKVVYVVGQTADYADLVVTATYSDLTTQVIPFESLVITGFDASVAVDDQVITVTYAEVSTTFMIDVIEKAATGIVIQSLPKTNYVLNEASDFSGLVVAATYNDDSTEVLDNLDLTITGFDSTMTGEVIITVTYLTFDTSFNIMVSEDVVLDYVQVDTADMNFSTEGLVANTTLYRDFFSGESAADSSLYDILLGRVQNVTERPLQYSTAIYFTDEGTEAILMVQTNGASALAVRIPDGMTAADITAFSFSMNAEHTTALADTVTFRPSFRFSSVFGGVEYFHAQNNGTYVLGQSGALTVAYADYTRPGYYDYTVEITQPELAEGMTIGNYILMYMGNNGSFRDSSNTSLKIDNFKFWTKDVVTDATLTTQPTKTTYEVGETFDSAGLVVTPTYGISLYGAPAEVNHSELSFTYDFSTVGEKVVTVTYRTYTFDINVTVVEPVVPEE